jgi:hypothetical protein
MDLLLNRGTTGTFISAPYTPDYQLPESGKRVDGLQVGSLGGCGDRVPRGIDRVGGRCRGTCVGGRLP